MSERLAPWPADHAALSVLHINIASCDSPLEIEQRSTSSYVETGTTVWNAALVLIDYFNTLSLNANEWKSKRVLELGCGTGAVGLSLAKRSADVTLTDRGFILDLARANADRNFPGRKEAVRIQELTWAAPISALPLFDFVVCSDVLYEGAALLSATLELLCVRQPEITIFLAYQSRNEAVELPFWEAMSDKFNCNRHRNDSVFIEERDSQRREALNEIAVYEITPRK